MLGVAPVPASIGAEERHLLCSLIESAQFGPGVKACFDRQWISANSSSQSSSAGTPASAAATAAAASTVVAPVDGVWRSILAESVAAKQAQIRAICQEHYSEFLAGIDHLLSVKLDLSELRALAHSLNAGVQQSGRAVLEAARLLNEQRRIRYQLNSAKQIVSSCASLIALARKAKAQIHHAKYFSALKTLHQLQRILHVAASNFHKSNQQALAQAQAAAAVAAATAAAGGSGGFSSPKSGLLGSGNSGAKDAAAAASLVAASQARFEFIRQLERQIPLLTGKIKESVKSEFTTWLAGISKRSQAIGELALSQLDDFLTLTEKKRSVARKRMQADRMKLLQRQAATAAAEKSSGSRGKKAAVAAIDDDDDDDDDLSGGGGNGAGGDDFDDVSGLALNSSLLFETHPINFTSVYQCLHIYEHLNLAETFQALYKERRRGQLMESVHQLAVLGNIGLAPPSGAASAAASPKPSASGKSLASPSSASLSSPSSASASSAASPTSASSNSGGGGKKADFIEVYTGVFAAISGFFIVEDSILKSGNELMSRAEIDTLYEKTQGLLIQYLSHHLSSSASNGGGAAAFSNPSYFLQLKYVIVLFIKSMDESFLAMNSHLLSSFLVDQRARFERALLSKLSRDVASIFAKEKWEPLGINDDVEFALFISSFALSAPGVQIVDFPCTMPFSISVPLISRSLQNFIEDYLGFAKYLEEGGGSTGSGGAGGGSGSSGGGGQGDSSNASRSGWKAHVLRAVDKALSGEINRLFMDALNNSSNAQSQGDAGGLPISQTVQFSINAQVLSELTCPFLERYIESYGDDDSTDLSSFSAQNSAASASSIPQLTSRGLLLSTKLHCEDLIFELISHKIDQFLDLGSAENWTPDQPSPRPSSHVEDCVAYLEITFSTMTFMPDAVREAIHFTSCKHLADLMLGPLTDPNHPRCKKFNIVAIANLNQDLHVLEAFAQRCPIQNLVETFSEIRQLVDLLLSGDVEMLLDSTLRSAKYAHLSTAKLVRVLDKFRDMSLFSMNTPPQFKKLKKKNVEAVVKKLQKMQQ